MALSKLDSLYMAVVADHSRNPHHQGELEGVMPVCLHNPSCGDVIKLSLRFENSLVKELAFSGEGCSISTASASMMTDCIKGKTIEQASHMADVFSEMVQGKDSPEQEALGDAVFLAGVAKFPQRIKCATLAWNALKQALADQEVDEDSVIRKE